MALDKYFPEESIQIIAEPGRYFVASAFTIGVNVIAKRVVTRDRKGESKYFGKAGLPFKCFIALVKVLFFSVQ